MQEVEVGEIHVPFMLTCYCIHAGGETWGQIHVSIKAFIYHMFRQRI